ncbi:sulfite dehydrogenase [Azospirillum sp.]|uniref:sulfite dehydrogenase n=1 Tax=Azospirillum sp. TaxID=34012 RepID=UPI002D46A0D9|nr:sulfite dehydrogenase [Azospirillum sp.]HYD65482.1 sulfite dehydrogenase [Azospirillum sp.]
MSGAAAARAGGIPKDLPDWTAGMGPGVTDEPYGAPSKFEAHVVRRNVEWLTASTESSVNFTPLQDLNGILTPNGLFFERHHSGRADVDPAQHRLVIHGMVERPVSLTMEDLYRLPPVDRIAFTECAANGGMEWRGAQLNGVQFVRGMLGCAQWTGVSVRTLLEHTGVRLGAKWVLAEGADNAALDRSIPLDKMLDDAVVAYAQNGERLRPGQGYPIRLVLPGYEGNMWVKWLRRLEVGDEPWYTRWETSKYTDLLPTGKAIRFSFVQEANSVITAPSPEKPLNGPGPYVIRGLAWSGNGRIARVDVSTDGGKNWVQAPLQEPVLPKALTRFYLPWRWDGGSALLQCRAIDETGYVQPTIEALRKVRGRNAIYHNNSIVTWLVNTTGEVENVQVA